MSLTPSILNWWMSFYPLRQWFVYLWIKCDYMFVYHVFSIQWLCLGNFKPGDKVFVGGLCQNLTKSNTKSLF